MNSISRASFFDASHLNTPLQLITRYQMVRSYKLNNFQLSRFRQRNFIEKSRYKSREQRYVRECTIKTYINRKKKEKGNFASLNK